MKKRTVSFILIASLLSFKAFSQIKADDILGVWMIGGKEPAKIQSINQGRNITVRSSGLRIQLKTEKNALMEIIRMKQSEKIP